MIGSFAVAYSAQSVRISRVRMMAPRSGGARESRSWHDLHAAHESAGQNRHVYMVVQYEYMSVGDVLNGLIYLILSFTTRVDAVWRVLLPFKEG